VDLAAGERECVAADDVERGGDLVGEVGEEAPLLVVASFES
jgi:hypothetical protein